MSDFSLIFLLFHYSVILQCDNTSVSLRFAPLVRLCSLGRNDRKECCVILQCDSTSVSLRFAPLVRLCSLGRNDRKECCVITQCDGTSVSPRFAPLVCLCLLGRNDRAGCCVILQYIPPVTVILSETKNLKRPIRLCSG